MAEAAQHQFLAAELPIRYLQILVASKLLQYVLFTASGIYLHIVSCCLAT